MEKRNMKKIISEAYGEIAGENSSSCCGPSSCSADNTSYLERIGYSEEEIDSIPQEANLSLGCGNPTALAQLKAGETVLDLGCGAGVDCFLAATKVGAQGKVIGVDMTLEMLERARNNAREYDVSNVEFRLGEIENLPLADSSVDVVISNCVINLSADKNRVFQEIFRVLKPGGRISISDIALKGELPQPVKESEQAYVGCIAGALLKHDYERLIKEQGFKEVEIIEEDSSACVDSFTNDPVAGQILNAVEGCREDVVQQLKEVVKSVHIKGRK